MLSDVKEIVTYPKKDYICHPVRGLKTVALIPVTRPANNKKSHTMSTRRNILIALCGAAILAAAPHSELQAKSRKTKKEQLNFEAASEATLASEAAPSNTAPAGIGQSTAIKAFNSLSRQKVALQQQADALGRQLATTNGKGKKKKITRQIDEIAAQIRGVDSRIEALPRSVRMGENSSEAEKAAAQQMVNSMIDERLKAQGINEKPSFDILDTEEPVQQQYQPAPASSLRYRVQLAAVRQPNLSAFRSLKGVTEGRSSSGMYVYYYGSYATKADAEAACQRVKSTTSYRDAFVVATDGDKRISLSAAAAMERR